MKKVVFALLAGVSSVSSSAQLQDWERPSRLDILNKSFAVLARTCATDFGFTPLPPLPISVARDRLKAYLDLSGDGDVQEREWLTLMEHRNSMLGKDGTIATRASDAIEAAIDDPSTYAQAEQLYVRTVSEGARDVLADCDKFAHDPYIRNHYLTGEGRIVKTDESLRKDFASSVAEVATYKKRIWPKGK